MGCCECIAKGGVVDMVSVQVSRIKRIADQILQVALAIIFCQRGVVVMVSVQVAGKLSKFIIEQTTSS